MSSTTLAAVTAKLAAFGLPAKAAGVAVVVGVGVGVPGVAYGVSTSQDVPPAVEQPAPEATAPEQAATDAPTDAPTGTPSASPEATASPTDLPEASEFGQRVAQDARDGGVDGQVISQEARERAGVTQPEQAADHAGQAGRDALPEQAQTGAEQRTTPDAPSTEAPARLDAGARAEG